MRTAPPRYAAGLYRVSTAEQGHSGLGLEAQHTSVRACILAQGWTLIAGFSGIASGKDDHRPGFQAALARALNERGIAPPTGRGIWTHTTVARVTARCRSIDACA